MQDAQILETMIATALAAGEEILAVYATDFSVAQKSDASPLTEADERAEAVILNRLGQALPDLPIVSEEAVEAGHMPQVGARFILVDPLDGTKEFVSRNGEFTVNIALVEDGAPRIGVVYVPAFSMLYAGIAGEGAFHAEIEDGKMGARHPIAVRQPPEVGLTAVASRSHAQAETEAWLASLTVAEMVNAGSSLKFCLVASGRADVYPRLGRTMEWDTAAGDAILRAAGGRVSRVDGTPLDYGKVTANPDAPFANPHFVAWGRAR